jgi:hypothetical protein
MLMENPEVVEKVHRRMDALDRDFEADSTLKLFRSVMAHFVELMLSVEQIAHRVMFLGPIVSFEWRELSKRCRELECIALLSRLFRLRRFDESKHFTLEELRSIESDLLSFGNTGRPSIDQLLAIVKSAIFIIDFKRFIETFHAPAAEFADLSTFLQRRDRALFESPWHFANTNFVLEVIDANTRKYTGFYVEFSQGFLPSPELADLKPWHPAIVDSLYNDLRLHILDIIDTIQALAHHCGDPARKCPDMLQRYAPSHNRLTFKAKGPFLRIHQLAIATPERRTQ